MWNNECEGIVTLFIFYSPKNHPMSNFNMDVGLSIQSNDLTHPKIPTGSDPKTGRPDQVTGRRRVICSKNQLRRVGLGFPPKTRKNPIRPMY